MINRLLLVVFALALCVVASMSAANAIVSQQSAGGTDEAFFTNLVTAQPVLPLSSRAADAVLQRCISVVGGIFGALQPPAMAELARAHCLGLAQQATVSMPSYALGWHTRAMFAYQLGTFQEAGRSLEMAQKTGRHEQYLTEMRVQLAESYLDTLSDSLLEAHSTDLELLARSRRGTDSIAARYVSQPDFRERITVIVENLSVEEQARFVANVRQAAARLGMVPEGQ